MTVTIDTAGMTERERRAVERASRAALRRDLRTRYMAEHGRAPRGERLARLYALADEMGLSDREAQEALYSTA